MAGFFYELLFCELVLKIGEGGFNAGVVDQILIALLVAGVVVSRRTRTIYRGVAASRLLEVL